MHSQFSSRFVVLAGILVLSFFLVGVSLVPAALEIIMRSQVRCCGVVGVVAFVALASIAGVCNRMVDPPSVQPGQVPAGQLSPSQSPPGLKTLKELGVR